MIRTVDNILDLVNLPVDRISSRPLHISSERTNFRFLISSILRILICLNFRIDHHHGSFFHFISHFSILLKK